MEIDMKNAPALVYSRMPSGLPGIVVIQHEPGLFDQDRLTVLDLLEVRIAGDFADVLIGDGEAQLCAAAWGM